MSVPWGRSRGWDSTRKPPRLGGYCEAGEYECPLGLGRKSPCRAILIVGHVPYLSILRLHRLHDSTSHHVRSCSKGIGRQMRVPARCLGLCMAEELAYKGKAQPGPGPERSEAVPQVVNPHIG